MDCDSALAMKLIAQNCLDKKDSLLVDVMEKIDWQASLGDFSMDYAIGSIAVDRIMEKLRQKGFKVQQKGYRQNGAFVNIAISWDVEDDSSDAK